ncbi:hypothetical protein ACUXNS_003026, partial [Brevibacterium pityocampae]
NSTAGGIAATRSSRPRYRFATHTLPKDAAKQMISSTSHSDDWLTGIGQPVTMEP